MSKANIRVTIESSTAQPLPRVAALPAMTATPEELSYLLWVTHGPTRPPRLPRFRWFDVACDEEEWPDGPTHPVLMWAHARWTHTIGPA